MTNESLHTAGRTETRETLVLEESKSFVAFELWMDEQLEQLVARWIHAAAPNANRPRKSRESFGR